ncbi:hypothetical protein WR25_15031 [Diploscapter pachys]|uniref:ShKT domain-containing protein n=1 Tax=Diploscapter pachys TaxID=2018661 RepID=A0A2A2LJU3_9BILA|nr:hypothetical protein WR25_15031 [Diploscapter pachys]
MLANLPVELILLICEYPEFKDLGQLSWTSNRMMKIIKKHLPILLKGKILFYRPDPPEWRWITSIAYFKDKLYYLGGEKSRVDVVYSRLATICKDKLSLAECKQRFGGGNDTTVKVDGFEDRPFQCFGTTATGPIDPAIKKAAIENCPAFCGYCCQTPAYNCKDKDFPRIACDRVTDAMCQDTVWKAIIAENCPSK